LEQRRTRGVKAGMNGGAGCGNLVGRLAIDPIALSVSKV
jgi:hypothetical protein